MAKRHSDALAIQDGACNPVAICNSISSAVKEVYAEGGGTDEARADPAIRLMVHQLAYLFQIYEIDRDLDIYGALRKECIAKK